MNIFTYKSSVRSLMISVFIIVLLAVLSVSLIGWAQSATAQENTSPGSVRGNSLVEKPDRYEFSFTQRLPNTGEATAELMKNRPEVRFKKWNGEVDVGISYDKVSANGSLVASANRVEWKGGKEELHAYPIDGENFEIEIVLSEKPDTNIFNFTVDGAENLDFFYQPKLTQQEIDDGVSRSENVVGSYAVYHKTKKDHKEGELNYATGKIFHIYRPKAIDSGDAEVWGSLSYADGTLSVEIPQDFLDEATYPTRIDPTFGYTTIGGSSADSSNAVGSKFTMNAENGTLEKITAYTDANSGTVEITAALYSDNSGAPDALLSEATTSTTGVGTSPSWVDVTMDSYSLIASTVYWLWHGDDTSESRRINWDAGSTNQYNIQGLTPWPDPITPGTYFARKVSIYATYTAPGNNAPTAPTSLESEGQTNPTEISDSTPELTAIYNDPDTSDLSTDYQIQVDDNSDFSSTIWDSTKTALASSTSESNRIAEISYSGSALSSSTTYYWRIKFWDDSAAEGAWSTATSTFSLAAEGGGGGGAATTTSYIHTDHLGGTNVVTDEDGALVEVTDYYPFGEQRIHTTETGFTEQRKFTGHEYDSSSDLTYAEQRYYEQDIGKFLSIDPVARDNPARFLQDPQQLNSYSYARNNPLVLVDPTGEEPVRGQLGTSQDIGRLLQHVEKIYAGDSRSVQLAAVRSQINDNSSRYIYTSERGWIDTRHVFGFAQYSQSLPASLLEKGGWLVELGQSLFPSTKGSSFSYEDLASNKFGVELGKNLRDGQSSLSGEFAYLMEAAGATQPSNSPNYDTISNTTSVRVEGNNYSSRPLYSGTNDED